jgi:hypothetical protein
MQNERLAIAKQCLAAAYDGSRSFPEIVGALIDAQFEGYLVDYRAGVQTCYGPAGEHAVLAMPHLSGAVAADFDAEAVAALVRWAQANEADYNFAAFCERVTASGCAGYLVSFGGRRVIYFGRSGELHVEHFPRAE